MPYVTETCKLISASGRRCKHRRMLIPQKGRIQNACYKMLIIIFYTNTHFYYLLICHGSILMFSVPKSILANYTASMDIASMDGEEILTNWYMQDSFTLLQRDEEDSWHKMEETQVASKLYRMFACSLQIFTFLKQSTGTTKAKTFDQIHVLYALMLHI